MRVKKLTVSYIPFLMILWIIACSCVGTVKTADPQNTKVSSSTKSVIDNFDGIQSAVAISNSKVELFFNPVATDVDKYTYVISYDGQQIPIYVSANSLKGDYRGLVKYTASGLDSNKKYTFQIQVRDIIAQTESSNNIKVSATTFSNPTANFLGVSEVRNLSGSAGLTGIEVIWPEAEVKGTDVFKNEIDPIEYKVTVIDSNFLTPGNINDNAFSEPQRKIFSASGSKRNIVINGLKPNTKYFVQVRCIHHGYTANSANALYKLEENTTYVEITTYSDDLASVNFNTNSFFLSWPPGNGGLYALNGNWSFPNGNFDHYRIYYAEKGTVNIQSFLNTEDVDYLCFSSETQNSNVFCAEATYDKTNASLTGLIPNTNYDAILAVCLTSGCERGKRLLSSTQTKMTSPNIANFSGISTIDTSNDIVNLNTLTLNFLSPDFSSGNISGFLVDFYGNNPDSTTPIALNDSAVINTTTITVDDFDYQSATSITLRGIDYTSTDQQCFMIYPFAYTNLGTKIVSKSGLLPQCITPLLKGPTLQEFSGFTSSVDQCDAAIRQVTLTWDAPTKGIYDQYEIFYIKSDTDSFSFSNAVNYESNPNYHRIVLDGSKTDYTLTNMATGAGAVYKIGILSYYNAPNSPVRSEFNLKTITCDFR